MTSLEVTTHGFANGGEAVARADGRVVFVRGGLPDERLRVRITDDRKASFAHAEVLEVLDASPHRLPESSCAAARHGAGCCDLAFADIGFTRELKTGALLDLLTRIGRLTDAEIDATGIRDAGVAALGTGRRRAGGSAPDSSSTTPGHPASGPSTGPTSSSATRVPSPSPC